MIWDKNLLADLGAARTQWLRAMGPRERGPARLLLIAARLLEPLNASQPREIRLGHTAPVSPSPSADHQHQPASYVTVLAGAMRLGDLGEREGSVDRKPESPGLD